MVLDHKTNLGWTGFCIMNIKGLHRDHTQFHSH